MVPPKLKTDLKKLAQLPHVDELKKQLAQYEKRVLGVIHEVDLKGREARKKGEAQISRFASELRARRSTLEKQLRALVTKEKDRLNDGIGELLSHLTKISKSEKATAPAPVAPTAAKKSKASAGKKASATRKRTPAGTTTRKRTGASTVSAPAN